MPTRDGERAGGDPEQWLRGAPMTARTGKNRETTFGKGSGARCVTQPGVPEPGAIATGDKQDGFNRKGDSI
ncbi:MAG: hypothetical protein GEU76_00890 [Alphaproteobacteria bacterium]|nr:hypothetical protein [Alphaproteobacteria bacterium]